MEGDQRICLPTFFPDREVSFQDQKEVPELILVAPVWPTQPRFAVLLSMLFQRPIILPNHPSLLRNPLNELHPLIHQLNLAASVRTSLESQGISKGASALTLSSWRKATETAYSCSWRRWEQWCTRSGCSSIHAPLRFWISWLVNMLRASSTEQ